MLPLVIVRPIKMRSFANGYGSVSGRIWHVIIIEGHSVIGRLIVLVSSSPPLLGDFLFGVAIFACGVCYAFLALCFKLLVLGLELIKLLHEVLQGWCLGGSQLGSYLNGNCIAIFIGLWWKFFNFIPGLRHRLFKQLSSFSES
jgi:hypothetical protein